MKLRFYANIRTAVGLSSLETEMEGLNTLRKLVAFLVEQYPQLSSHLLDDKQELRSDVPVYVDGRNPRLLKDGIDTVLTRDAEVSFFSPISSGRMNVEILRDPVSG